MSRKKKLALIKARIYDAVAARKVIRYYPEAEGNYFPRRPRIFAISETELYGLFCDSTSYFVFRATRLLLSMTTNHNLVRAHERKREREGEIT